MVSQLNKIPIKEALELTFEDSLCRQYAQAIAIPPKVLKSCEDDKDLLTFDVLGYDGNLSLEMNCQQFLTLDTAYRLTVKQILKTYIEPSEADIITICERSSKRYRGVAIVSMQARFIALDKVEGDVMIKCDGNTKLMIATPYDLFRTLVNAGYLDKYEDYQ
jgi:hypothetical protein